MDINLVKPNPNNPRFIKDEKFEKLKKSLQEFPKMLELRPIVVNEDNVILGGNMRYKAAQALGLKEIPVTVAKGLTEEQQREFVIKDNISGGEWDWDILANEWEKEQLEDWGLDVDFATQENEVEEDDYEVEPPKEPKAKLGDVYELGEHRLMCGDATKKEDVEKLMNGQKADMVFTDPPYGIDYQDTKGKHEKIANDASDPTALIWEALQFHQGIPAYLCCNWRSLNWIITAMEQAKFGPKACIVWDKEVRVQNLDKFFKQHEFIVYSGPYGGEKTIDGDVWRCNREVRADHPTAKPVELCGKAIRYSSEDGGVVLDLFGGSGSTLIACEQTNRKCYMMELDPKYIDVIIDRWEKFTGEKAKPVS